MLRAAQFAARFGFEPSDRRTREAMRAAAPLRAPRFRPSASATSCTKLFARAEPSIGLEMLRKTGVLAHLWPELLEGVGVDQNEWHAYDV